MSTPVRLGIIGCGSVMSGPYMSHIDVLRGRRLVEVAIACDVDASCRSMVMERFGIPAFTTDYREVVESDQVDLVLVLTSMPAHGPITAAALEAGKHVLVEKPLAVTLEEGARLIQLAERSRGYLVCAPHVVLSSTYQAIWCHLHLGDIGKVLLARARYGWAGPTWNEWCYQQGCGALFDLAIYNITTLTGWLGPARRVTAMAGVAIPGREIGRTRVEVQAKDNAHILLDFGDSVFAEITTGFTLQQYRSPAIELYGSVGTPQMMGDYWAPQGYEMWRNETDAWHIYKELDPNWPWTDGLRHLVDCILRQEWPIITPEHAYHAMEIVVKARLASTSGEAQPIESTFTPPSFASAEGDEPVHLLHNVRR